MRYVVYTSFVVAAVVTFNVPSFAWSQEPSGISVSNDNAHYWSYDGTPRVLLGGSGVDNLFQWVGSKREDLIEQLDALSAAGGNYLRNTMSDRDPEAAYPFFERDDGQYDLERWNSDYWDRLRTFLDETQDRKSVV